ncbi:GGDEF domain-containing protein [Rubeoparvulum massiliense]|uniref:GGDEF domain-containing protein n=1 Tax=Rubeoparvulum massiliense TaxID=1631346 RepID=UPI00065E6FD0|nr:sensor domain-containing diguanylate cyclase [Rubeoparvulum massiliense]
MKRWLIITSLLGSYLLFFNFATLEHFFMEVEDHFLIFIAFLFLYLLVNLFPFTIHGEAFTMSLAITLPFFLEYGVFAEAFLTQLAHISAFIALRIFSIERIAINLLILLYTSLGSGFFYYYLGGELGKPLIAYTSHDLFLVILYVLAYLLLNRLLVKSARSMLNKEKMENFFAEDFWQELLTYVILFPIGFIIYGLYQMMGVGSLFYMAFPILAFSYIFRLYHQLQELNHRLSRLNEISQFLTSKLQVNEVVKELIQSLQGLAQYDFAYLFLVDEKRHHLAPVAIDGPAVTPEVEAVFLQTPVPIGKGLSGLAAERQEIIRTTKSRREAHWEHEPLLFQPQSSIVAFPLLINRNLFGVLTLSTQEAGVYSKRDEMLLGILASEAAIALKNAEHFEETRKRAEVDEMTGLYNYRYFERQLYLLFQELTPNSTMSLILLDIDHFKQVNDRYGHYAGNQILQHIAQLMQGEVEALQLQDAFVARYGGEEFVVVLPEYNVDQAYEFADCIREKIEQSHIQVCNDLECEGTSEENMEEVEITVSMGLANYPQHAEDPLSLIRHADRAMYIGAKQAGRNKVAVYEQG